ncbi:MAG: hypothetical protein Q9222_006114 [Ikaeria aurantiellina]
MDPVSVAASVLTVLGAAATAARTLDQISALRHAPDHLIALVNEVSDLRVVLHNIRDAIQGRAHSSQECGNLSYIVQRANQKLSELNRLIYGSLLKSSNGCNSLNDDDTIKASRRAFLRHNGKIKSLKEEIQEIKMSLLVAMGTLTFSDVSRLKVDVCDVSLVATQRNQIMQGNQTAHSAAVDDGTTAIESRSTNTQHRAPAVQDNWIDQQVMRPAAEYEVLPNLASSVGNNVLQPAGADQKYSHVRVEASVSSVSYRRDPVTPGNSDFYVQASLGNIEKLQGMLSLNAGSFNVIDSVAHKSPLHTALQFRQVATIAFLIEQGADMYVQDCNNKTPLDTFYENYFITTGDKRMEALLPLFERYDVFDHWNLKQIHLIILGWSSVDLATYLSISLDEVDVFDSWGRTPLMWAAWRGDSESVAILLDHGANPTATSHDGNSVLTYATYGASVDCMRLILDTGVDINHMSQSLITPAMGGSQLNDNIAIARVRLARGAAIEASKDQKFTPLYVAALCNRAESLAFLLECGASTEWSTWNCSDPLSLAISFSNHRMAQELIRKGVDLNNAPQFTVSYLRNVSVFGDEQMLKLFAGARPAIDVSLRDAQGCTAEDRMNERLLSMGPSDPRKEGLAAAFKELVDICSEEYEKAQKPPEYTSNDEVSSDEEDVEETFHDAVEDQQAPTVVPTYGTQVTDWAARQALHPVPQGSSQKLPTG